MSDTVDNLFGGGQSQGYGAMEDQIRQAMAAQQQQEAGAEQAINPYEQAGRQALGQEQSFLGGMSDPQAYINKILAGYQQSPAAKFQIEQGIQAGNRGAAASGMLGSGAEQKALSEYGQQVSSRDMQNYLNNILGVGKTYLQGQGGLANMGMRGAEDIGGYKMGLGQQYGQDYGGIGQAQYGQARAKGDLTKNIGMIGQFF